MNSTLLRTAAPAWAPLCTRPDALVLPAASAAPAALVIAVDAPVSQETSALTQVVALGTGSMDARALSAVAAHGYAAAVKPFRTAAVNAPQGPPSRGTPV